MSEIQETLAELKARIAEVENKLSELEQFTEEVEDIPVEEALPEPVADDINPIDISIDDEDFGEAGLAEPEAVSVTETVPEPETEAEPEPEDAGDLLSDDAPSISKTSINDRQERNVKKAVMDVMGQKLAWKVAIPGTPVKNVISAISLNDRVLFINTLFKEDPMAFQEAIAAFNGMSSFEEAEDYVRTNHPDWNLNSDLVFRLMMAVRRKLR